MPKADVKFTVQDYMSLTEEFPRYELVEGELLLTPSPSFRHQDIAKNMLIKLHAWVEGNSLGTVVSAPMDVILSNETVLQPDVIVILDENRHIIQERIEGPPDLVVEILSPSTADRDTTAKRRLYARHGVKEYWIVEPNRRGAIEVNEWTKKGYRLFQSFAYSETLSSPLFPGLSYVLSEIFDQ